MGCGASVEKPKQAAPKPTPAPSTPKPAPAVPPPKAGPRAGESDGEKALRESDEANRAAARAAQEAARRAAAEALAAVERRLDQGMLPIDVLFVSMGDDGHIASLFPEGVENSETRRKVVAASSPRPPHERISLAPWVLQGATRIILPIFGDKKQALFDRVIQQDLSTEYPVWHVLCHDDPRCEVFLAP